EEVSFDYLRAHVGELFLRELLRCDRHSELHALARVVDGRFEARLRRADGAPRNAETSLRQASERTLQAADVREPVLFRHAAFVEHDFSRLTRTEAHLAVDAR